MTHTQLEDLELALQAHVQRVEMLPAQVFLMRGALDRIAAGTYGHCAGCHGENGRDGIAISLANPVYLAIAGGATLRQAISSGVTGTLMPAFDRSEGGTLTAQQVDSLVEGILRAWGRQDALGPSTAPSYSTERTSISSTIASVRK